VAKRLREPVPHARTVREAVSPELDHALERVLAKMPADRFRTAEEFLRALSQPISDLAVTGTPQQALQTARTASGRRGQWRKAMLGLAAFLTVSVTWALLTWHANAALTRLDGDLVAVAPFDVLDPKLQLWSEGLVDLFARNLDGAGPLRTVPPTAVIRRWRGPADKTSAGALGRRTGARLTVFGSLVPAGGDSARLQATLYDVSAGRALAELDLRDAVSRIDRLSDSMTVRLLGELGRTRHLELTRVASLGSTSLPALKAFLQGEQWFRRTAWDSATASYERAVALDSSFCLALWRLGRVLGWQRIGGDSLAGALSLRAGALNRGLAPRDSLLVLVDSIFEAEVPPTWAWYTRLRATALEAVRRYPDDADAWHTLGEVYDHQGSLRDVPPSETLSAFDRAILLDSAYAPAYIHAIEEASRVYGLKAAERYAREYLRRAPGDVTAEGIRLALRLADPEQAPPQVAEGPLRRSSANVLLKAWLPFYGATDSTEVAVRMARALAASPDTSAPWLPATVRHTILVSALSYRGHLREAAQAWEPDMPAASTFLTELSLLRASLTERTGAYFRERLRAGDLRSSRDGLSWWLTLGDSASILRFQHLADSLARSSSDPSVREHGTYGGAAARAYLALVRHDTTEALRRFEHLPDSLCLGCYSAAITRLFLWSASSADRHVVEATGPWSFLPSANEVIARFEQGRAAERLDQRARAISCYQFVLDAWRRADPELQWYVAEAREGLARLTAEPGPEGK